MSDVGDLFQMIGSMSDADLTRELAELEGRAELIRAALHYRQSRRPHLSAADQLGPQPGEPPGPDPARRPQSRRPGILRLMREQPRHRWPFRQVRDELIRRGELRDDERDTHALGVAMGKMVTGGLLERPERGYYRLAPTDQAVLADKRGAEP